MTESDTQNPPIFLKFLGAAIIGTSILIVLFSGAGGLTDSAVKQQLQRFSDSFAQEVKGPNKQAKLEYDSIRMEGWGYNKQAIIQNVSLAISETALLDTSRLLFSTSTLIVTADPATEGRFYFIFPEPINVIENSELKGVITFPSPLRYSVFEGKEKEEAVQVHQLYLPEQIVWTPPKAAGETMVAPMEPVVITYDKSPFLQAKWFPEQQRHISDYRINNLSWKEGDMEYAWASLSAYMSEKKVSEGRFDGTYALTISDFILRQANAGAMPYNVNIDIGYTSNTPGINFDMLWSRRANASIVFNNLALMGKDFKVRAYGAMNATLNDPLPYGKIDVEITNVGQLLASDIIPESTRAPIKIALEKISGKPFDTLTNVSFPIARDAQAGFFVGSITFEEFVGTFLSEFISPSKPSKSSVLPPENVPVGEQVP